jgi:hypothetical protein
MFFIVRWMELSYPDIDNKFTGLITLNCSELFLRGIDARRKFIGHGGRNKSNWVTSPVPLRFEHGECDS